MSRGRDFWSDRRAAVQAEGQAEQQARAAQQAELDRAALEARDDAEILAELDLPDPDTLKAGDDVRGFMSQAVPDRLRRRALRQLWKLNPVLANVDGLVDYGEDFTDAATVLENMQTAYQVGKGMLAHIEDLARKEDAPLAEPVPAPQTADLPPEAEEVALAKPDTAPEVSTDHAISEPEDPPLPTPRRMRFSFDTDARSA